MLFTAVSQQSCKTKEGCGLEEKYKNPDLETIKRGKSNLFPKSKRKNFIPLFLVPKVRKRHVIPIFQAFEIPWKLFAEGALRNRFFHEEIMNRGPKCLACDRHFNGENAAVSSKIEKHHHCYLRFCIGKLLPPDSDDIYRQAKDSEFSLVPDLSLIHISEPTRPY